MSLKPRFAVFFFPIASAAACGRPASTRPLVPDAGAGDVNIPRPSASAAPVSAPPQQPTPPPPAACPQDMAEVTGNYCTNLWHWCLEGYPTIGSQWTTYYPNGAPGVEYCEKYVVGKTACKGSERPMHFCVDRYEYPGKGELPRVM